MLHLEFNLFCKFIKTMSAKSDISPDILEKDYYVCLILNELSKKQDYLKAYFKGGTAVYKLLNSENRFSEDIDLTVEVINEESNSSNRIRLKKSALGYNIEGLELQKENTIDKKGSVTAFYKYNKYFYGDLPIVKGNQVQIEATSFTESKPIELATIEPLIYKYADAKQKETLEKEFDIKPFPIYAQSLERIFIDKIVAAENYLDKEDFLNVSKHLYDIAILIKNDKIQDFLMDKIEVSNIFKIKRIEETRRYSGLEPDKKILDFKIFDVKSLNKIIDDFEVMQDIYVYNSEYRLPFSQIKTTLNVLYDALCDVNEEEVVTEDEDEL